MLAAVDGVQSVEALRLRWIGHTLRAEADISVDPRLSLAAAHEVTHRAEDALRAGVRRLTAVTVHASPAGVHTGPAAGAVHVA